MDYNDLRNWVYTLKSDTEILTSEVSSTRLRLKILESRDRDFDETFCLAQPQLQL